MRLPQQPKYSCSVVTNNGKEIDVTMDMIGDVTYSEEGDYLNMFEFTLTNATYYHALISRGAQVNFDGGAIDAENPSNLDNYKPFFRGHIIKITYSFPNTGFPEIHYRCLDGVGVKGTREFDTYKYPGKVVPTNVVVSQNGVAPVNDIPIGRRKRDWANKKSLKASDIVRGIVNDMNEINRGFIDVKFGELENGDEAILITNDKTFTLTSPETQKDESDWAFLRRFAKKLNCVIWSELDKGVQKIYFVAYEHCKNIENSLSFVYPERGATGEGEKSSDLFTIDSLNPNQMLLTEVTVDEDSNNAMAVSRTYVKLGKDSHGESAFTEIMEFYDHETGKLYRYELDQQKAKEFSDLHGLGDISNLAWNGTEADILAFYKKVEVPKEIADKEFATIGSPMQGVKMNAKCEGNTRIKARQHYKVFGILKFSSGAEKNDFRGDWYLWRCSHTWSTDGYNCDMSFMK